ncbi:hypothetical protein D9M72_645090 [compost metagenome]|jgi:hypothetical protein
MCVAVAYHTETLASGISEQRVIRQFDCDSIEIAVERAIRLDGEHAAPSRIPKTVNIYLSRHKVCSGRVRPDIDRIIVTTQ